MTSSESKEPKGSERSSSELKCRFTAAGRPHCFDHTDSRCCGCDLLDPSAAKPILRCRCGHDRPMHERKGLTLCVGCPCQEFRCDHTRCGWKPREEAHDFSSPSHCAACAKTWVGRGVAAVEDESPLTPEEEEEAPEDTRDWRHASPEAGLTCTRCGMVHKNWDGSECPAMQAEAEPLPPQPERRPPYAIAYSVQGHLFEVALSGDASIRAVDGALVIQHHLGPVAGIVSVLPVINKES